MVDPHRPTPRPTPLVIESLIDISEHFENEEEGVVLERIVSAHPLFPEVSVTTVLYHPYRIVVYNGTESLRLHASFPLEERPLSFCWAKFPSGDHALLCALLNSATVALWDVFPTATSTDSSWTVSLPFECSAIFEIPRNAGLLLQRQPNPDDRIDSDNETFILQSPPKVRRDAVASYSPKQNTSVSPEDPLPVASLFSLQHPLEDVLPLCQIVPSPDPKLDPPTWPFTDAFEQVIWVGPAVGGTVVAVTYHTIKARHSVWLVQDAPPAAPLPPLYQRTRVQRQGSSYMEFLDSENNDDTPVMNVTSTFTRNEALADALGVNGGRKSTTPRNVNKSPRRTTFDHSFLTTTPRGEPNYALGNMYIGSSINARISLQLVYRQEQASPQGRVVSLLGGYSCCDNKDGDGTACLLGLVSDQLVQWLEVRAEFVEAKERPQALFLCGVRLSVEARGEQECLAAQPIQATPVLGKLPSPMASELLLLTQEHGGQTKLVLCRPTSTIVECALPTDYSDLRVIDIIESFQNYVSFTCMDPSNGKTKTFRGSISLRSRSSLTEKALAVIDAALIAASQVRPDRSALQDMALRIRADSCRLEQTLCDSATCLSELPLDVGWIAAQTVIIALIKFELYGAQSLKSLFPASAADNVWDVLLHSEYHRAYMLSRNDEIFLGTESVTEGWDLEESALYALQSIHSLSITLLQTATLGPIVPLLFDSIHLLYEDCKLCIVAVENFLPRLGSLLSTISSWAEPRSGSMDNYVIHYRFDGCLPARQAIPATVGRDAITSFGFSPPSFFHWIEGLMQGKHQLGIFSTSTITGINAACSRMRSIHRIFTTLFTSEGSERDFSVVAALIEEGFTEATKVSKELPAGIALPLLEVLYRCRNNPAVAELPGWSSLAWSLVGRDDLSKNMCDTSAANDTYHSLYSHEEEFTDEDNDGLVPLEKSCAMLFPDDNRVHEAGRLLRSSRPIFLRVERAVEVSDHEYEKLKQKKLVRFVRRALALSLGRGMLSLGGLHPIAAEPLPIPELCLKGRVPPTNASLALDESEFPPDMCVWPEFHNGVAAGLRLPAACESTFQVSRTWIIYNRPPPAATTQVDPDDAAPRSQKKLHSHGGFLLALGLRGHLAALDMSDIYEYLTQGSVTTTVGVLLGLAANKRGSCDMSVSKMLCLHIPSLIPQHFSAIDVASTVQAAAVLGAGLLFQKSSHRMMTEFLLNEIGKRPESDATAFDRESYALSCGLALGMVNLSVGDKSFNENRIAGIADLRLEERLIRYIVGGVDSDESRRARETNDRFSIPSSSPNGDNEKCSTIHEGNLINTDVTSPGATLALGLMYLKTGNRTIASALKLPDTHFLLEFVRPDFLALRLVAKSMVLWDDVKPTNEWIVEQIPIVVRKAYSDMRVMAQKALEGAAVSPNKGTEIDYDRRAVRQIYTHLVAGASFGMGLRFAGTGDAGARSALFERALELHTLREATDAVTTACRPELSIVDSCLACVAISLAMVLAGTGDLDALKLFKILRWRCDERTGYGTHMAFGMAIGLLFLGGGTCTLGRDAEDIAALVTAFFPRYPFSMSDNQYHLQALRHLWTLAARRREIYAVDVDSGELVHVPVEIRLRNIPNPIQTKVPCLLRNYEQPLEELVVKSDRYYPIRVRLREGGRFYVKKRGVVPSECPVAVVEDPLTNDSCFLKSYSDYIGYGNDNLFDYVFSHREETLPLYLSLRGVGQSALTPHLLWQLRLIRTYYEEYHRLATPKPLLNVSLVASLYETAERALLREAESNADKAALCALSFYDLK